MIKGPFSTELEARKAMPNFAILRSAVGGFFVFAEGWHAIGHKTTKG